MQILQEGVYTMQKRKTLRKFKDDKTERCMDCERDDQKKPMKCTVCKQEKRRSDFKNHELRHFNDRSRHNTTRCEDCHTCRTCKVTKSGHAFGAESNTCMQCELTIRCAVCKENVTRAKYPESEIKRHKRSTNQNDLRCTACHTCRTCEARLKRTAFDKANSQCIECCKKKNINAALATRHGMLYTSTN